MCAQLLVVEDNEANLALMAYLLRSFGHDVITATDGQEALQAARRCRPDLIVCDIQIPKLDGYAVAAELQSQPAFRKVPLVAVTALAMVGDRDHVLSRGFDAYISKPINPETFVKEVESLLPSDLRGGSAEPGAPALSRRRKTVLVVDDVAVNIEVARSALEPSGYEVLEARTVAEALDLARQRRPSLILTDIHMPHQTGVELLKACRADPELSAIPLVVTSNTYFAKEDRALCLALGAVDFVMRPVEARDLIERVERHLRAA